MRLDSARILGLFTHTTIFTEKIIAFPRREIDESRSELKPSSIGFSVKREQRDAAAKVAEATGAPFLILDCNAPQAVITSWLAQRQADKNDPSDATLSVIEEQQANRDPLTAEELLLSKRVETNQSGTLDALVAQIRQRAGAGRLAATSARWTQRFGWCIRRF